jgi:nucleoside-diphosphate-sugar epimerase
MVSKPANERVKVFLTGATGFIGSHVARVFLEQGCEVHALIRKTSDVYRIREILPSLKVLTGDLLDEEIDQQVRRIRPEVCIHLAWYVQPGKYPAALENMDLLRASLRLAETLADCGCQRLVAAGTLFEYDPRLTNAVSEAGPTNPRHLYAASKLALYEALSQFCRLAKIRFAWTRLFYQYGPYEHPQRLIPTIINSLLHDQVAKLSPGDQVCDYLHVTDTAAALARITRSEISGIINVGSGEPHTVKEIAQCIGQLMGKPQLIALNALPYVPDWPMHLVADNSRLIRETTWRPRFTLNDGLRNAIDWWRNRP